MFLSIHGGVALRLEIQSHWSECVRIGLQIKGSKNSKTCMRAPRMCLIVCVLADFFLTHPLLQQDLKFFKHWVIFGSTPLLFSQSWFAWVETGHTAFQ